MFSTTCRKCKTKVSMRSHVCPNCGAKEPGFRMRQVPAGILLVGLICFGFSKCDSDDSAVANSGTSAQKECLFNDGQCYFSQYMVDAMGPCKRLVERAAKYDIEWTDGAFEPIFSDYRLKSKERQLIFFGDKVKFTNGFNAKVNMIYACTFDFKTKSVVDIGVSEGRL